MTYAFTFDARSCTGCKTCQVACQDRNNLPPGLLWRRVYEVSGGQWIPHRQVWTNDVFAYNLSLACNHCVHPKCAGVCPASAYLVAPNGIVSIDPSLCIGCGYCAWACPYDAPQFNPASGLMTKCDLCASNLQAGLPPACVAACPLRCLDLVQVEDPALPPQAIALWQVPGADHPYPLPAWSRTEPRLVVQPHPATARARLEGQVSNREEITPRPPHPAHEIPLLLFTLLTQAAAGTFIYSFLLSFLPSSSSGLGQLPLPALLACGAALAVAMLFSLFHLGRPRNAWRALAHLKKSWLSREILLTLLFATLLAIQVLLLILRVPTPLALSALTAVCAAAAVHAIHRVYRLRAQPGWNTPRTLLEFILTSTALGAPLAAVFLPSTAPPLAVEALSLTCFLAFLLARQVAQSVAPLTPKQKALSRWRPRLLVVAMFTAIFLFLYPAAAGRGVLAILIPLAFLEEALGRWLFYQRRTPGI